MAKMSDRVPPGITLFNSPLETGVRTVIVLNAVYPAKLDLASLTLLDHLVVHTADVDGPSSLHPNLPQRSGEMLVRRRLIEDGIKLMRRFQMIIVQADGDGISYQAGDDALPFTELLRSEYGMKLKDRARWLAENVFVLGEQGMGALVSEKLGRWGIEFQSVDVGLPGVSQ